MDNMNKGNLQNMDNTPQIVNVINTFMGTIIVVIILVLIFIILWIFLHPKT